MKLLTYENNGRPRCGILQEDHVIEVSALLGTRQTLKDVQALLELGDDAIAVSYTHLTLPTNREV